MDPKIYFVLTVISCAIFGFSFLLAPSLLAELHGVEKTEGFTILLMRLYGGSLVSIAVMAFDAMNAGPSLARKSIFLFLVVVDVFNTLLNVLYMKEYGAMPINYLEMIVTLLFGIGAFYFWKNEKL